VIYGSALVMSSGMLRRDISCRFIIIIIINSIDVGLRLVFDHTTTSLYGNAAATLAAHYTLSFISPQM